MIRKWIKGECRHLCRYCKVKWWCDYDQFRLIKFSNNYFNRK